MLDLIIAGMALVLVGMAVALRSRISPGFLGLALVNMTNLSHSLTSLVQFWTQLETSIGAVARIKTFSEQTPAEGSGEERPMSDSDWPRKGTLTFECVSATYR